MSMTPSQEFVYVRTYSRWLDDLQRRETWPETVNRYFSFFRKRFGEKVPKKVWELTEKQVLNMGVMPSMRAMWAAGETLEKNNITAYNCSYVPFDNLSAPVDTFYILMCGTGVGFSVEKQYIEKMPEVQKFSSSGAGIYVVGDSREGWAESLRVGLTHWFNGVDVEFDYSKVRPRGARLKTMGGRASGPEPLKRLHDFTRNIIINAQGRKLTSVEWLDIGNMIAEVVVVGGVRRSSEISFSDLSDEGMRNAKNWPMPPHRHMSNNSAVYYGKPDAITFMKEWASLAASGSGERGIFNLSSVLNHIPKRREKADFRTNPCGEILLRPRQFCNLSEVVVRSTDTFDDLVEKVKSAVWLGAMQATLTDFPFISPEFKKNCEEEHLLGVSLTGQMDNPKLMTEEKLSILRDLAIKTARKACKVLEINMSAAITTGKPSGTVSQLVLSGSGMHTWHDKYYIRRYRISATDPLYLMMKEQGVKFDPENGQGPEATEEARQSLVAKGISASEAKSLIPDWAPDQVKTWVVAFPIKAPEGAITRNNMNAIDQLEWYLKIQNNWCEHNQSCTIYVKDNEWLEVGNWVYKHFDEICGVSFLPYDGGNYSLAPYESITKEKYEKMVKAFPKIDYSQLSKYELEDFTTGAQALACVGGACEIL